MVSVPEMLRPHIERSIAEVGQHLQGAFPTADNPGPGFMYTIGMYPLPDLLCIGSFPPEIIGTMLNAMCDLLREKGEPWEDGMLDIDWTVPVKVRTCGNRAREEFTIQAGQFYEHEAYRVIQVMICDKNGVYQDEGGCAFGKVDLP